MGYESMDGGNILCGHTSIKGYFHKLSEGREMKVEITIYDENEDPYIVVANGEQEGFVNISFVDDRDGEIRIEDLKCALRKLSAR